jgi:hypothetical protein
MGIRRILLVRSKARAGSGHPRSEFDAGASVLVVHRAAACTSLLPEKKKRGFSLPLPSWRHVGLCSPAQHLVTHADGVGTQPDCLMGRRVASVSVASVFRHSTSGVRACRQRASMYGLLISAPPGRYWTLWTRG